MSFYQKLAVKICGGLADRLYPHFKAIKGPLERCDLKILYRTYLSLTLFSSLLTFSLTLLFLILLRVLQIFPIPLVLIPSIAFGALAFVFLLAYLYPKQKLSQEKKSIDRNLSFAVEHMAAIAMSKVPPYLIFKLLSSFEQYGEVSRDAEKIVRRVDIFGQDVPTAIKQVAEETPSRDFKDLLRGMVSTIETGGSLENFFRVQEQKAMRDFRRKRKKYTKLLSTYADIYTGIMIAAPLFLIAILAVMSMIGGKVLGFGIKTLMRLGIYLGIPIANSGFILFVHLTQPEQV